MTSAKRNPKCQIVGCHDDAIWAMQLLPGDDRATFSALGWQYRGFPVVKTCEECHHRIRYGEQVTIRIKAQDIEYKEKRTE